jgi:DNA-binding NtrC family response regulator
MIAIADPKHHLARQQFRFALVVEESHSLRNAVVNVLKTQDWFVHGILRAEQALHILAYIPYRLIVIDSELPGISGIDFVRIVHNSREWRTMRLVVMTSSQNVNLATEVAECGAFLLRKANWKADLFRILASCDEESTEIAINGRPSLPVAEFSDVVQRSEQFQC